MEKGFPFREAFVTGASSGLGRAFAMALMERGAVVWGSSRDGMRLPEGVRAVALDLGDGVSVKACVERLRAEAPGLDLLVNNAGSGVFGPFSVMSQESVRGQWRVLLEAPVALCGAFFPGFVARGHGGIVNVASLAGVFPVPCMGVYSAAKAGMSAFSRALMVEAHGSGVMVVDFLPGDFATEFNKAMRRESPGEVAWAERVWARCEELLRGAPAAERAAVALMRALERGRSCRVVTGSFWQASLGPMLARFAPEGAVRWFLRGYYGLRERGGR
jgi:short-subunit dehydrogenase